MVTLFLPASWLAYSRMFFITPDPSGIPGEPGISGFPIFGWEITLEDFP
jgi:hypothetical protein